MGTGRFVAANERWLELTPEGTGCPWAEQSRVLWDRFGRGLTREPALGRAVLGSVRRSGMEGR